MLGANLALDSLVAPESRPRDYLERGPTHPSHGFATASLRLCSARLVSAGGSNASGHQRRRCRSLPARASASLQHARPVPGPQAMIYLIEGDLSRRADPSAAGQLRHLR